MRYISHSSAYGARASPYWFSHSCDLRLQIGVVELCNTGSKRSQHLRGEACDFQPYRCTIEEAFEKIATEVREKRLNVGQLLLERGWIHISLGYPTRRSKIRCNEIGHQEPDGRVIIDERIK